MIPQARGEGPGKSGVGGSLGNQGAWGGGTVYAYESGGKLTPETNESNHFPNIGMETMLLQPPWLFQGQQRVMLFLVCLRIQTVSCLLKNPEYPQDDKIQHEKHITVASVECRLMP